MLNEAMNTLKIKTSLGTDEHPAECYKLFVEEFLPLFLAYFSLTILKIILKKNNILVHHVTDQFLY